MSIRSWWKKNVTEPRRRKEFTGLRSRHGRSKPSHFRAVKRGLLNVKLQLMTNRRVDVPGAGICFNAGFLIGGDNREGYETFISLAWMFNNEVRGITPKAWGWHDPYPFYDIDVRTLDEYWEGRGLEVRLACIDWIINNIEKYQLDKV
ncbi:hypothetical protein [Xanthomonas phage BUDD]|nr:hypothetical protein [Xanthomonas phage BUDD]